MIRHGEAAHNLSPEILAGRVNEAPLTDTGRLQPVALGRALAVAGLQPKRVYASPAVRTLDTAELTLEAMGVGAPEIIVQDELQELGHGPWEGLPREKAYTPEAFIRMRREQKDFKFPRGESMNDVSRRVLGWLSIIFPEPTSEPEQYLVFTHAGTIKYPAGSILGLDHQQSYEQQVGNATLSLFLGSGNYWSVPYLSRGADVIMQKGLL